jgi:hypothetical protein
MTTQRCHCGRLTSLAGMNCQDPEAMRNMHPLAQPGPESMRNMLAQNRLAEDAEWAEFRERYAARPSRLRRFLRWLRGAEAGTGHQR